jgi:lysophospholipase L1-like esterase
MLNIQKGEKLVMIGDSVTDCERSRPVGEGLFNALGRGYAANVDALLSAVYPELGIRVVNVGTSGNTVRDLKARWQTDVLDLKPDWLSVMIGINDVWRQYDVRIKEQHVYLEEYEATYREILQAVRPKLKGLILLTPYFIETSTDDAMRRTMDEYGAVVRKLAAEFDAVLVDTQEAFNQLLAHMHSAHIAWDRVHPNHIGHMTLAKAFLDSIGFEWNRQ